MQDVKHNRQHKDVLFKYVLKDKTDLLELYNAINGSTYADPEELEYNTLEDAVYLGIKNDVSFIIHNSMNLYEHQSTMNPNLECVATVMNINSGHNETIVGKCGKLFQYIQFHGKIREFQEQGYPMEEAVDKAVSYCVEHDILRQILVENRSAFMDDILTTYDAEKHMELIARENYEEGFEQGIEQGFHNGQNQINRLTSLLLEKNLIDDLRRCTEDQDYQRELLVKYNIISEA